MSHEYQFSANWLGYRIGIWEKILEHLKGRPNLFFLEIGSFEGRSAIWFLENILTHESSRIICIDPLPRAAFFSNIIPFQKQVTLIPQNSQIALRNEFFRENMFDLIYVDGSHAATDVLEDAVLSFRLLKQKGILIFDDYQWKKDDSINEVKCAIDAWLSVYKDQFHLIRKASQVIVEKI